MTNDYTKMTDAELNAEVARRLGWTLRETAPGIFLYFDADESCYSPCDYEWANDLNEAVKLPGFNSLDRVRSPGLFDYVGDVSLYTAEDDYPARAVVLAFLAADDAKGAGDAN